MFRIFTQNGKTPPHVIIHLSTPPLAKLHLMRIIYTQIDRLIIVFLSREISPRKTHYILRRWSAPVFFFFFFFYYSPFSRSLRDTYTHTACWRRRRDDRRCLRHYRLAYTTPLERELLVFLEIESAIERVIEDRLGRWERIMREVDFCFWNLMLYSVVRYYTL